MYLFQKIEAAAFKENDARRVIGSFLLENKDELSGYSMSDIAKLTHTSKPTLVRFAKYFEFSGWKEFMYAFLHELAHFDSNDSIVDVNIPFNQETETIEMIENIANLRMQSIKETTSLISTSDINKAALVINNAQTIAIYGRSPNSFFGELFRRNLTTIHKKAIIANSDESGMLSNTLTSNDCAVVISYSGDNAESYPMKNIKNLRANNVPIISLTSGGENFLRTYSDIVLTIASREKLYSKISNFSTEESILFILNILYSKVFSLEYETNIKTKIGNSRALEIERRAILKNITEEF